jgi:very-short-patch-repair endonuclease
MKWNNRYARPLRKGSTFAELRIWYFLRARRFEGHKFRRQHPIGKYIVDFCCLNERLVIELDGGQHADRQVYDEMRTRFLESQGFRVLRFWDDDVFKQTECVLEEIRKALKAPSP